MPTRSCRQAAARNSEWFHMINDDIISMPDKWEYPVVCGLGSGLPYPAAVDRGSGLRQAAAGSDAAGSLSAPQRADPAYEWNFSDVNPAGARLGHALPVPDEQALHGEAIVEFLKRRFSKLLLNFTWWVNRKDRFGKNVFEGGFLGLDNIGVFDRRAPLPTGGYLEQADGTAWMALFCQNMLESRLNWPSTIPATKTWSSSSPSTSSGSPRP